MLSLSSTGSAWQSPTHLKTWLRGHFWEAFPIVPGCSSPALSCPLFLHPSFTVLIMPLSPPTLAPEALVILGLPGQCVTEQAGAMIQGDLASLLTSCDLAHCLLQALLSSSPSGVLQGPCVEPVRWCPGTAYLRAERVGCA